MIKSKIMNDDRTIVICANCGDTGYFILPDDCNWFCTIECYEDYNDIHASD